MDGANKEPAQGELVVEERTGAVARLTLSRPGARNALSMPLMEALQARLDAIDADPSVQVVVIAGSGPGFCAGHDLREVRANPGRAFYERLFATCSTLMQRIMTIRQPVIAEVHGIATAAGCQLVATCDLAIAGESARFATPGVNIGLFCSTPMVALSRAVPRKRAMHMLLTGEMLPAAEALSYGLVSEVVPDAELRAATDARAAQIASKSPAAIRIGKRAFYEQIEKPVAGAYEHAGRVMTENMLKRDAEEGIDAFLEKRPPVWSPPEE